MDGDSSKPGDRALDPVCGMSVDPASASHRAEHGGVTYFFCCAGCRTRFMAEPDRYLAGKLQPPTVEAPKPAGPIHGTYSCPMHPEVQQPGPGGCPVCGMALEPRVPTLTQGRSPELADMSRRFAVAATLALGVMVVAMTLTRPLGQWIQFALTSPVVLWSGLPLLERGWESLQQRSLNMFTLISLGIGTTYLDSTLAVLAPQLFPSIARQADGSVPVYFEAAAMITALVLLGQVLELRARAKTGDAIQALLRLSPASATRVRPDGHDETIALEAVRVGDRLRVRAAERVPVDGQVVEGHSAVDESMMTGEATPSEKLPGQPVIGGTLNGNGTLVIRAERVGSATLLARIVHSVAEAQRSRAPIQQLADTISVWFVPVVVLVAALAFFAWMIWGPPPAFAYALTAAVSVLIIACPCALGLATPMSITVGMGKGATAGILIRNAEALECLEKVDTLVLDKTGTLTEGRPRVVGVVASAGHTEDAVLAWAASLERSSEHVLAGAIVSESQHRNLPLLEVTAFRAVPGQGITGQIDGKRVALGTARLLRDLGVLTAPLETSAGLARHGGATSVFLAIDARLAGMIALADPIRSTTPRALDQLRALGLRIVMLTGDNLLTAEAVAQKLGIREVAAELLPEQKKLFVARLRHASRVVAMAGDGVNDAPALAAADVGIAMGSASDVALETAGVTLIKGELPAIVRARELSRLTMRNIRQNLFLAFVYNALGLPVAAGALYPIFGWLLSPVIAAAAMSLSSVSVVANALRLRFERL